MRKFLWLGIVLFLANELVAQQLPLYSLYREHSFVLNPGIAGSEDHGIGALSYRQQWTKIEGAPKTLSASYRTPIYKRNIGVGAHLVNDITGPTSFTGLTGAVSYHIDFKKINPFHWARFLRKSKISIGLSFSMYQYRLDANQLLLDQPNDQAINSSNNSKFLPNAGLGVYYYYDKFFLGYSIPTVIPLDVSFNEGTTISNLKREIHHYLVVGGKIPFGESYKPTLTLEPMVWFKQVKGAPWQIDANVRLNFKNIFWVGAGFRSSMTVLANAGVIIKDGLHIGYAFDQQVSDTRAYIGSSHEFLISYHLPAKKRKYKR